MKGMRVLLTIGLMLLLPLQAGAVSLGDLTVRSVPGQPLRAHIPFTLLPGENLAEVRDLCELGTLSHSRSHLATCQAGARCARFTNSMRPRLLRHSSFKGRS